MRSICYLFLVFSLCLFSVETVQAEGSSDRKFWVKTMIRIIDPVYQNLSENRLRENMPVEVNDGLNNGKRADVTHLEALGRSFCGIAPWLNLGEDDTDEGKLRAKYIDLSIKAISNAVNPDSPDYMTFDGPGAQPLVDAAFLAQGLLRSKNVIWARLDNITKDRLIKSFISSRKIKPSESNWLLFSAIIEATLLEFTGECQMEPINYALMRFEQWYSGDGCYGDGPRLHIDYYNSYVIQPMLMDIMAILKQHNIDCDKFYKQQTKRFIRQAQIQEGLISPEGTYPVIGRSNAYRFGAFQVLAQASLMQILPETLKSSQVRCALTKVIKRQINAPGTFDKDGWLQIGVCGHQKGMAEDYISTGSLYLCTFVFLPLGLDEDSPFWSDKAEEWTSLKLWNGKPVQRDHALYD